MHEPRTGLDTAWLRGVLARAGHRAAALELLSAEPVGLGNTSEVLRLQLAGAGNLPASLIAKLPLRMPDGSVPPGDLFGYDREVAAYRFFGADPPLRIPRCFAAEQDGAGFTLLLEDLGADCRPGDQIAGCGTSDAKAVVDELAALHARYWCSPEVAGHDWINRRWLHADRTAALFAGGAAVMRPRYADHLGGAALALIEAAAPLIRDWAATPPFAPTLIHADPRVDNVIFEAAKSTDGGRACLIDLQSISLGDAAFDLAYFLTGSLEPAERAACERDLVAAHAAAIPGYDAATAWRRYRQFAIAGLVATVSAAGLLGERANVPQIAALARRNCAAVAALDGLAGARERISEGAAMGERA